MEVKGGQYRWRLVGQGTVKRYEAQVRAPKGLLNPMIQLDHHYLLLLLTFCFSSHSKQFSG